MVRFAMTLAGILFGMLSVVVLIHPIAPQVELETLMARYAACAVVSLIVFFIVDHSDKDVTGASFSLVPFAGPSAAGMVSSPFLSLFGIPVVFLMATAVWLRTMMGAFRVMSAHREVRHDAIVWQLSCVARLAFYASSVALFAIVANYALLAKSVGTGFY